jgi:hypothetical protein
MTATLIVKLKIYDVDYTRIMRMLCSKIFFISVMTEIAWESPLIYNISIF